MLKTRHSIFIGTVLIVLFACSLGTVSPEGDIASRNLPVKPNIIYILADDLGYGDLGVTGQVHVPTPNIDQLANAGILFTQHYSGAAVCAPSRSTLLTGNHTGNTQIRGNGGKKKQAYLKAGTPTLGNILQSAGYTTGTIGKWGLGDYQNEGAPNRQGMDYFYGFIDQILAHNYYPEYLWENGEKRFFDNGGISMHPKHVDIENRLIEDVYKEFIGKDYAAYHMQGKALNFIRENSNSPFLLYYASLIPHAALQIPDEELAPFNFDEKPFAGGYYSPHPRPKAARAAMISLLDRQVGEIVALTEELGIADNTIIIFTSDNGASPESSSRSDMEFFNANAGFRGYKRSTTEGGIRAPMIAYWPSVIEPSQVTNHLAAMWDVLPTAAELAGIRAPDDIDGISFLPTLLGVDGQKQHEFLYWEYHEKGGDGPSQAVRWGDWKGVRMLRDKGNVSYVDMPIMLFDIAADPFEKKDIARENPDAVEKIAELMQARKTSPHSNWNFQ